ncbi:MAG: hypothetical protein VYA60_04735 [Pseudomonadota bacterium]|nr:hypothetical protein [Pseudomonadota bacterium]
MSTLARIGSVTMPSARTLESILGITNNGLRSFDLSELAEVCASRIDMMLSFNELSGLGLFYEVKNNSHNSAVNKGVRYLVNAKTCAEVLLNYKPNLILGKRFYKFELKGQSLYAGFIKDESDICNLIKQQAEQVFGVELSEVPEEAVTAVEVTGMQSIYNDKDFNDSDENESLSSEGADSLLEALMMTQKPTFDIFAHKSEGVEEKKKGVSDSNTDHIGFDVIPQYSIFGPKKGVYGWVTHPERVSDFPS